MDGVLLIDKPAGPTSHDVVARLRRSSGERSIGHAGTLDPRATGLLVLVVGRATRLAFMLTGGVKTYDARIRLGFATDSDDADGHPIGARSASLPDDEAIGLALDMFRGSFEQMPPAYSAKKVGGRKAYDLARRDQAVVLKPVRVTVHRLERVTRDGDRLDVRVSASAGFYVRALARDLGERLGCGAHLAELRRTSSGTFDIGAALPLDAAERLGRDVANRLVPLVDVLPDLPTVRVTEAGRVRTVHGNALGPNHVDNSWPHTPSDAAPAPRVRILAPDGGLLALGEWRGGVLHPVLVLGYH